MMLGEGCREISGVPNSIAWDYKKMLAEIRSFFSTAHSNVAKSVFHFHLRKDGTASYFFSLPQMNVHLKEYLMPGIPIVN